MTNTTTKETYNKGLMVSIFAGIIVLLGVGALVWFKGDVLLFAVTNSAQVRAEKASWDGYIKAYPNE